MIRTTAALLALVLLGACGTAGTPHPEPRVDGAGGEIAVGSGAELTTAVAPGLGAVLTDGEGLTLYRFDGDRPAPSRSTCDDTCALRRPPLLADSANFGVQGVERRLVGTVTRADGRLQATVAGLPLYRFADDVLCGEAKGHTFDGAWFASRPDGTKAG